MKLIFKINTKPMTQAAIIIAIVIISSGSLAAIAINSPSPPVCIFCAVILAIVVYLALRLAPH